MLSSNDVEETKVVIRVMGCKGKVEVEATEING
jgi:hypothetical protein